MKTNRLIFLALWLLTTHLHANSAAEANLGARAATEARSRMRPACDGQGDQLLRETPGQVLPAGGDLFTAVIASPIQCAALCASDARCWGVAYHRPSRSCLLKGPETAHYLYDATEWTSFVKVPAAIRDFPGQVLVKGNDLASFRTASATECKSVCACVGGCAGYTYHAADQSCFLKDLAASRQPYPVAGWESGVKYPN